MSGIETKSELDALRVGWLGAYLTALETYPVEYTKIARIINTKHRSVVDGGTSMLGKMREWVGDRVFHGASEDAQVHYHKPYEHSWEVHKIDIDDDTLEMVPGLFAEAGEIANQGKDEIFFDVVNNATTLVGYDGVPLFHAAHPIKTDGGAAETQSNYLTGANPAWYLLDGRSAVSRAFNFIMRKEVTTVRRDKEDDDPAFLRGNYQYGLDGRFGASVGVYQRAVCSKEPLTSDNLGKAIKLMKSLRRRNGLKAKIIPTAIAVPVELEEKARAAIKSQFAFTNGMISSENMWLNAVPEIMTFADLSDT